MTGSSLAAVLLYLLYSATLALLPPELLTTEHVITETDSVTLHCRTPSYLSGHQCFIYIEDTKDTISLSCMKTLMGTELLSRSKQSAPAVVQVRCFYTVMYEHLRSPSPHSEISSIVIQNAPTESQPKQLQTQGSSSSIPSSCWPTAGWTLTNTDDAFTSTLNPGGAASGGSDEKNKDKAGMSIFALIIAVACFGVIVGVILLGLMLWRTVSERRKRQNDKTQDEYHMYSTITDDLSPPAKKDILYTKVERH